jgi:hypothetical protein
LETRELRRALAGGATDAATFPAIDGDAWDGLLSGRSIKEITYERILGEPYFVVRSTPDRAAGTTIAEQVAAYGEGGDVDGEGDGGAAKRAGVERTLVAAETLEVRREPFTVDALMGRVRETYPDVAIVEAVLLEEYDSYHYSQDRRAPLPILRVKFDDPNETWMYIDPASGRLARSLHRLDRVERWIYHGFHSLDFSFWYQNRPIWDIGVIVLSLGGLATSAIGLFVGTRRLLRGRRVRSPS